MPASKPHAANHDKARRITARHATDTNDLHYLLDVLGLWPHQDGTSPQIPPMPLDPCATFHRRAVTGPNP